MGPRVIQAVVLRQLAFYGLQIRNGSKALHGRCAFVRFFACEQALSHASVQLSKNTKTATALRETAEITVLM